MHDRALEAKNKEMQRYKGKFKCFFLYKGLLSWTQNIMKFQNFFLSWKNI